MKNWIILFVAVSLLLLLGVVVFADEPFTKYHPSFSPDGKDIVFSSNLEGKWNIYRTSASGNSAIRITDNKANHYFPMWFPDGRRIAFYSDRDGNREIYVINRHDSKITRLTQNDSKDQYPSASPDGKRIVFSSDRSGGMNVFVMNQDGSEQTALTKGFTDIFRPIWSPDGNFIYFEGTKEPLNEDENPLLLYRINPDGSDLKMMSDKHEHHYNFIISPDGKKFLYDAHFNGVWESDDGGWEIYAINSDGTERRRLTQNDVNDWGASWSPDGKKIIYCSGMNNRYDFYVMNADGSDPTPIIIPGFQIQSKQ